MYGDSDESETVAMTQGDMDELFGSETVAMSMSLSDSSKSSSRKVVVPDARSDIYSLGATLYHLLSGKRPAKKATEVIPLYDKRFNKEFSPQIAAIIAKSMNPNPDLRYQTADEMLYAFTHLRENDPRTKRRRRIIAATYTTLTILLAGGIFTTFVGLKRIERVQAALTLAGDSQKALQAGEKELAIKYALEALPEEKNIFTPQYTSQAKRALADALGVYDLSDGFKAWHNVELPSEVLKVELSPDGSTGVAVYAFETAVFDTETGKIIASLPMAKSALSDVVYIDSDTIAYAGIDGLTVYSIKESKALWSGKAATHIAVSADKQRIAGVYRDEGFATVYNINGNEVATIDFGGNKQRVVNNDTFANPRDSLLALNNDGRYLAVSFESGGLMIFDTTASDYNSDENIEIFAMSDYTHFEGGFNGKYFAFSATKDGKSEFDIVDLEKLEFTLGFDLDSLVSVRADEECIRIANKSTVVKISPDNGEQEELAYADADVREFACNGTDTVVVTKKNEYLFYDSTADLISRNDAGQTECSFADVKGDYAVIAGGDSRIVKILQRKNYDTADVCTYDYNYAHDEARINADETSLMLFNYKGFRLYDMDGNVINTVEIPDAEYVYDQQYSKASGNLAVIYDDALRIYSGTTGELVFEDTGLKTVQYTNYGVSIYSADGSLRVIDIDTAQPVVNQAASGDCAVYCGMTVDDTMLNGKKLIGAGKTSSGYYFAIAEGDECTIYNESGKEQFKVKMSEQGEAFFTDNAIVLSPLHGTPTVYRLNDGTKLADLETDAYLTYITPIGELYIMSSYITTSGDKYSILLDADSYEPLAYIPYLTDITNDSLFFDYGKGKIRSTRLYSIGELIEEAQR
jgi:WD40 repeat protein